jgi:hypothetical protein
MMKITKDSRVEIACGTPIWGTIGENAEGAIDVKISLEGN